MKKIRTLFQGPVFVETGYGVHARSLAVALAKQEMFDLFLAPMPWGDCPPIPDEHAAREILTIFSSKYERLPNPDSKSWDLSVMVGLPHEFKRKAKVNVGVTAGTEVDRVPHSWIAQSSAMDLVVVPSSHSKRAFELAMAHHLPGCRLDGLVVCPEGANPFLFNEMSADQYVKCSRISSLQFGPQHNFLVVGHLWGTQESEIDRKNIVGTVRCFIETFLGRSDVGLVLKVSASSKSQFNSSEIENRISAIKASYGAAVPPIVLIPWHLTDLEMAALYNHPQITSYLSLTHGEGWGLPLLEAAFCSLPIIATNWSGHLDFLDAGIFQPVACDLHEIPSCAVWEPAIPAGARWAVVRKDDARRQLLWSVENGSEAKARARELAVRVRERYREENVQRQFLDLLLNVCERALP